MAADFLVGAVRGHHRGPGLDELASYLGFVSVLTVMSLVLASCSLSGEFPPSVCSPACWQGITPGLTTIDEAVKILGEPDRRGEDNFHYKGDAPSYRWG